ncbi:hypothetical protein GCK32_016911, partial [Trichostrongylus colubriformis]
EFHICMSAVAYNDRTDEIIAGIIMLTVSFLGNVLNISAVVLIYRTPHFHNAFGFICASHLLADVGLLSIYFFWAAPATILGYSEQLTLSYFGKQMGQLIMMFWYASIYGQLQIALNRLLAIFSPVLYSKGDYIQFFAFFPLILSYKCQIIDHKQQSLIYLQKISQSIGSAPEAAMLRKNTRLYLMNNTCIGMNLSIQKNPIMRL